MKSAYVIVNAGSGGGHDDERVQRLIELFERAGATAEVHLARGGVAWGHGNRLRNNKVVIPANAGIQ